MRALGALHGEVLLNWKTRRFSLLMFISFKFYIGNNKFWQRQKTMISLFKFAIARFCCMQGLPQWKTNKSRCPLTKNYSFANISLTWVDYFERISKNVKNDKVAQQPLSLSHKILMQTKTSKRDFFPLIFRQSWANLETKCARIEERSCCTFKTKSREAVIP